MGGKLVFALAEKRCMNFGTCGPNGNEYTGMSLVNIELIKLFNKGRDTINAGDCTGAEEIKDTIVDIMYVPLIQGTLRYAYKKANGGDEKAQAEGATFAAAVLPRIHAADSAAAKTIAKNMKISATTADAAAVKSAFESVYSALNINCAMVGGMTDSETGEYYPGMEPCTTTCAEESSATFMSPGLGEITCVTLSTISSDIMMLMCTEQGGEAACPSTCTVGGCTFATTMAPVAAPTAMTMAPTMKPTKRKRSKRMSKKSSKRAAGAARSRKRNNEEDSRMLKVLG